MGISESESIAGIKIPDPSTPLLDQFSAEIERYEIALNKLTLAVSPALQDHVRSEGSATPPGAEVKEAPQHRLHTLILEVGKLNNRLEAITGGIAF